MSNHADRLFSMGSLIGVRSFKYTSEDQMLVGPVYPTPFQPGTNVALCRKGERTFTPRKADIGRTITQVIVKVGETYIRAGSARVTTTRHGEKIQDGGIPPEALGLQRMMQHLLQFGVSPQSMGEVLRASGMTMEVEKAPQPVSLVHERREFDQKLAKRNEGHQVGQLGCTCGYYAYFDTDNNSHHRFGQVLGLIEGFGVTTVGDRGFRASRARLVALVGQPGKSHHLSVSEEVVKHYIDEKQVGPDTEFMPDWAPAKYNVPVFPTLQAALREYPLTNPNDVPEDLPEEALDG